LLGQGASGAGGSSAYTGGGGGSGGSNGGPSTCYGGNGGLYGGGRGTFMNNSFVFTAGNSAGGAVRIIWPGCARSFPSTRTANE
jgi:hypothetical protein